jgi:DNA helicase-2/ATP-dependent DNA helicase PcrA
MFFAPNPKQKLAIEHERGPMLVVAGAGTGKTTVLVQRVARLIREKLATPSEILCVTYMRNAARELKERIAAETGATPKEIQAYTIHGYCEGVLRRAGQDFKHVEKEDLWIYLRQNIQRLNLRYFSKASNPGEFLHDLLNLFDRCNDELKTSADYAAYVESLRKSNTPLPRVGKFKEGHEPSREEILARCDEIARVFAKVESVLATKGMMTYGQMIPATIKVLRSNPATLSQERERARFILIDEFQDCNRGQIELMAMLAGDDCNIFAVGDPDQAIYRFRGATSAAFEGFLVLYPDARGVVLDENQRSRSPILRNAFSLISENPGITVPTRSGDSFARTLPISVRDSKQPVQSRPVVAVIGRGREMEAHEVVARIEELRKIPASHPGKPRFGVLYRQHSHRDEMVTALSRRRIPYAVQGFNVIDTGEVRDLSAVLRVLGTAYDGTSLFRVCALPIFRLDPAVIQGGLRNSRVAPLTELLMTIPEGKKVIATIEEARGAVLKAGSKATQASEIAIRRFEFDPRNEAVTAFLRFVKKWETKSTTVSGKLDEFLSYFDWLSSARVAINVDSEDDPAPDSEVVRLMTAHSAKGLEFEHVFILRANSGSFPGNFKESLFEFPQELRASGIFQGDSRSAHTQEERRLFHVAMTRARDTLCLCATPGRGAKNPSPAGFLRNLLCDFKLRPSLSKNPPEGATDLLVERPMRPYTVDTIAARAAELQESAAGVAGWLLRPPSAALATASLSAGSIERYDTCPLKFKIHSEWKVPGTVSANILYGNVMHQMLKDYYDAVTAGKARTSEQSVGLFVQMMKDTAFEDDHQRDLYLAKGKAEVAEFVGARKNETPPKVLATEKTFDIKVGETRVNGRMDRIDDLGSKRVRIVDYKTGSPKDQDKADKSLQLSIYALAAQVAWGYDAEKLVLYNVEDQSEIETTRDVFELDAARAKIIEVAGSIAAGDFQANPGRHCGWCDYRELCPATEQRLYSIATAQAAVGKN